MLHFQAETYGPQVTRILAIDGGGGGSRPMELFPRACASEAARELLMNADARTLFPGARDPESALSGLFLYHSCLKEAHDLVHEFATIDGCYWHGIMHRMEGDAFNANYWFRRIGPHSVFPPLHRKAAALGYSAGEAWDPFAFVEFCHASARAKEDDLAKRIQLAEWQLLFHYCAAPISRMASR